MKRLIRFSMLVMILLFITGCGKNNENINTSQEIYDAVNEFVGMDFATGDNSVALEWLSTQNQLILDKYEKSMPLEVDFIRAYAALGTGDRAAALKYFSWCNEHEVNDQNVDILAKARYEMGRLCVYDGRYEEGYAIVDEISSLYKGKSDREVQIFIYALWSYDILEMPGGSQKAEEIMLEAVEMAEKYGFHSMAYVYYQMGFVYSYEDEFEKLSEFNLKALRAAIAEKDDYWIASVSADIGLNYYTERSFDKSLEYLFLGYNRINEYNVKHKYENINLEVYIADTIANVYIEIGDIDNALTYIEVVDNLLEFMDESKEKADSITKLYLTKAAYYLIKGYYSDALANVDMAYKRYQKEEFFLYTNFDISLNQLYGAVYYRLGNPKKSIAHYEESIEQFERNGVTFTEPEALKDLYHMAVDANDTAKEREYAERIISSLNYYSEGNTRNASMLIEEYEATERENEIEMLRFKNKNLNFLIGSFALLILVSANYIVLSRRKNRQIKRLNERLVEASMKDELTKLNNRRALNLYLEKEWNNICNGLEPVSIVMIDVDFFKKYNDYYGHIAGDEALADIAYAITQKLDGKHFAARYGGEEFMLVMENTSLEEANALMKDLQLTIEQMAIAHEKSSVSAYVTISVGIASTNDKLSYLEMIRNADEALYNAKATRNTIVTTQCTDNV